MDGPKAQWMRQIYIEAVQENKKPAQSTRYEVLREQAKAILPKEHYNYVEGGASTQGTERGNRTIFDDWQIVPHMLAGIDINDIDMHTELFGADFPSPFVVSPIGVQELIHKDRDVATAKAAVSLGIPYTHSSAASTPLDVIAKEADLGDDGSHGWFQLYWPSDDRLTESLLNRAKKAGYKVLVVTLDTWILGWRPKDLDEAFNPFLLGKGVANILSDPFFVQHYCEGKDPRRPDAPKDELFAASVAAVGLLNPGISRAWSELALLRRLWGDQPIVLKGIQSVLDATRAVEAGVDGIWVSNHGGRQVDGALSSLRALESISKMIHSLPLEIQPGLYASTSKPRNPDGDAEVDSAKPPARRRPYLIFDSGIRCGADAMKALCLGADAVAIGRPWVWGLACNGQDGVESVFKTLAADLELNMALAGIRSTKQLGPQVLARADRASL